MHRLLTGKTPAGTRIRRVAARVVAGAAVSFAMIAGRPANGAAQVTRADSAAILFDAAIRLDRAGRTDAADAMYRQILERFGDTPAGEEARRHLAGMPTGESTRSGRVELQVWTTLYGLWLGVAVPAAFGADGPEPYGIGLLVGGPAGFLTGLGLARSRELTDGQARAITFGGTWGTWQGLGWAEVLDFGEGVVCELDLCTSDGGEEERFGAMIAGGLAGIVTGIVLSKRTITPGVATSVSFGALWGTWFGVATGVLSNLEDDGLLAATLIGGNAGLLATALLAPGWNISRDRARLISIAGVVGGLAGAGIDLIAQPDDEETVIAIPLIGSIAGLALGATTTRNFDRAATPDQGRGEAALLEVDDGRLRLGEPLPMLTMTRAPLRRKRRLAPEARLMIFSARF